MLYFVKTAFRQILEVILWINLVVCMIGGGVVGRAFGENVGGGTAVMGLLGGAAGLLVGFLVNIVGGGFVATILDINSQLDTLISKGTNIDANVDRYLCALVTKGTTIDNNVKKLVDKNDVNKKEIENDVGDIKLS